MTGVEQFYVMENFKNGNTFSETWLELYTEHKRRQQDAAERKSA